MLPEVADGLRYLHSSAWVHRDIKPENIGHDIRGVVKLLDFGDAAPLPPCGFLREYKGTLGYRSPEMALCLHHCPWMLPFFVFKRAIKKRGFVHQFHPLWLLY